MARVNSNPVFKAYEEGSSSVYESTNETLGGATYLGIGIKTGILVLIAVASGFLASILLDQAPMVLYVGIIISCITSFVAVLVGTRNPNASMICGIIYSVGEGLTLGILTVLCNSIQGLEGVIPTAIVALAVIFITMLLLYTTGIVKPNNKIRTFIMSVLISYLVISLIAGIMALFGSTTLNYLLNSGPVAIVVSILLILVGALCLLTDFETSNNIVRSGADKKFEWIAALGLMVSLVYIFVQIVRLLIILASNNRN